MKKTSNNFNVNTKLLYEKSPYFLELEKKNNAHKNKLEIVKNEQVYDEIMTKEE